MDAKRDNIGPDDEAAARAALTAFVFAQESALLKKNLPQFAELRVSPSPVTFPCPSFGEAAAVASGIGVAGLPPDRLPTTLLFPSSVGALTEGEDTDAKLQLKRMHKQNQILQRTFTGKK